MCPTEIVEFSKQVEEFADRDTVVIGGSADNEFCHLAWRNDHDDLRDIQLPLIAAPKLARELVRIRKNVCCMRLSSSIRTATCNMPPAITSASAAM